MSGPEVAAARDDVDRVVEAWGRARPDLDTTPLQVLSRVTRLALHLDRARRASFAAFGLEPRHLRVFRTAADREVGLVEQVVTPMRRGRDAAAAARADEAV